MPLDTHRPSISANAANCKIYDTYRNKEFHLQANTILGCNTQLKTEWWSSKHTSETHQQQSVFGRWQNPAKNSVHHNADRSYDEGIVNKTWEIRDHSSSLWVHRTWRKLRNSRLTSRRYRIFANRGKVESWLCKFSKACKPTWIMQKWTEWRIIEAEWKQTLKFKFASEGSWKETAASWDFRFSLTPFGLVRKLGSTVGHEIITCILSVGTSAALRNFLLKYLASPLRNLFFLSLALFAFWLRSSVVSVLFSLISEIRLRSKHWLYLFLSFGGWPLGLPMLSSTVSLVLHCFQMTRTHLFIADSGLPGLRRRVWLRSRVRNWNALRRQAVKFWFVCMHLCLLCDHLAPTSSQSERATRLIALHMFFALMLPCPRCLPLSRESWELGEPDV